jgi:hypothetical protein
MSIHPEVCMVSRSGRCALIALVLMVASVPAWAQSQIGFTGGATIDPQQYYGGVYWRSPDFGGRFHLRPGIDGSTGDGLRMASINIDLIYAIPLGKSAWSLIQGGGPSIVIATSSDVDDGPREVHAGGGYLFGFAHNNGFFTEVRIGGGGFAPNLKAGAGWAIELK